MVCYSINQKELHIKANCIPEMRKDRIYHLLLLLGLPSFDIISAECGCPAGKGPTASCKHLGGLCFALEEFSRLGEIPDYIACTSKLQEWNKPRPKKLDILPVTNLSARRDTILLKEKKVSPIVSFDPRPLDQRTVSNDAIESFRCDLLSLHEPPAFLDILIPSTKKVENDHTYACSDGSSFENNTITATEFSTLDVETTNVPVFSQLKGEELLMCAVIKASLNVSCETREKIELETRSQSASQEWYAVRSKRITGSKSSKILSQKKRSISLLRECLYPKPLLEPLPKPIAWGRNSEPVAVNSYVLYMKEVLKKNVTVRPSGFIIHPDSGWLGASPDGIITDPACQHSTGLLEVKCPYSKRDKSPQEACSDSNFFCELIDSKVILKKNHGYYHQVQLQLYVAADFCSWCDFCVYTQKGISIQRILPDFKWRTESVQELDKFFNEYMLPEIITRKYKPRYYL